MLRSSNSRTRPLRPKSTGMALAPALQNYIQICQAIQFMLFVSPQSVHWSLNGTTKSRQTLKPHLLPSLRGLSVVRRFTTHEVHKQNVLQNVCKHKAQAPQACMCAETTARGTNGIRTCSTTPDPPTDQKTSHTRHPICTPALTLDDMVLGAALCLWWQTKLT